MSIRFESMPLHEEIESRQCEGEPRLEGGPGAMGDFFQTTDHAQHRQHSFHQHPRIPQAAITDFEIDWIALFGMEGRITQNNPLVFKSLNQGVKGSIGGVGASTIPGDDQTEVIEQLRERFSVLVELDPAGEHDVAAVRHRRRCNIERERPRVLDEMVGQPRLVAAGSALRSTSLTAISRRPGNICRRRSQQAGGS